jgi:uncharacterized membrane protein YvlD (DUF360 family)
MLFYTHLVWGLGLEDFFGSDGWLSPTAVKGTTGAYSFSYLWLIQRSGLLWTAHIAGLVVMALLTLGLFSRVMSVLAFIITASYVNRAHGALFGLDQINLMLSTYLMVGPSGAAYSLDRLWQRRGGGPAPAAAPSVGANIAVRLMQVHLCIIYLFAGTAKLMGPAWWDGTAMWKAVASLEYQSLDMTWLAHWPLALNLLTHVAVAWEVSYCALIWPRATRPIVLALAVPLHLGIAFCLGMITFGLVMLIANVAFVSPALVRALFARFRWAQANFEPAASAPAGAPKGGQPASRGRAAPGPSGNR